MIIFLDARGNIVVPSAPEPIGRNSNDAGIIYIVAPFSQSAQIYLTFTLPNGETVFGGLAAPAEYTEAAREAVGLASYLFAVKGTALSVWRYKLPGTVTLYAGTVQYTVVTITESMRATASGTFTVSRGNTINLPDDPPLDAWKALATAVSTADASAEEANVRGKRIEATLYGEDGMPDSPEDSVFARLAKMEQRLNAIKDYEGDSMVAAQLFPPTISPHVSDGIFDGIEIRNNEANGDSVVKWAIYELRVGSDEEIISEFVKHVDYAGECCVVDLKCNRIYSVAAVNAVGAESEMSEPTGFFVHSLGDAKVYMADETFKRIEEVEIGDQVPALDSEDGFENVTNVFKAYVDKVAEITLSDGRTVRFAEGALLVHCIDTSEHDFALESCTDLWLSFISGIGGSSVLRGDSGAYYKLAVGNHILSFRLPIGAEPDDHPTVEKIEWVELPEPMLAYSLGVDDGVCLVDGTVVFNITPTN